MGTKSASLPEPSGCGGWFVMLMLTCLLLTVNSLFTTGVYAAFETNAPAWLRHPRSGQYVLFLAPLAMLLAQLGLVAVVGRIARRLFSDR